MTSVQGGVKAENPAATSGWPYDRECESDPANERWISSSGNGIIGTANAQSVEDNFAKMIDYCESQVVQG